MMGTMDGGLAAQVRKKYFKVYLDYVKALLTGKLRLGGIHLSLTHDGRRIAHMGTQLLPGASARLDMVQSSTKSLFKLMEEQGIKTVSLPQIGAGIGGLKWDDVRLIIENEAKEYPDLTIELWEFKKMPKISK